MSGPRSDRAPSQSTGSASTSFLSLPIEIRIDIYNRVLAVPYSLYIFQEPGCPVESFAPEKHYAWLALLFTNRQVSGEAGAVLYGSNHFTLEEVESKRHQDSLLESFFNCIGPANAGSLSHFCINFPATEQTEEVQSGEIRLTEGSLKNLRLLQKECTKLNTLETLVYTESSSGLMKQDQINTNCVRGALLEINAQFRHIPSLSKIIVRFRSESPASSTREFLQDLGWIVLIDGR